MGRGKRKNRSYILGELNPQLSCIHNFLESESIIIKQGNEFKVSNCINCNKVKHTLINPFWRCEII